MTLMSVDTAGETFDVNCKDTQKARTEIFVAKLAANADPLTTANWYKLGRALSDFNKDIQAETQDVDGGNVKMTQKEILNMVKMDFSIELDHFNNIAMDLCTCSDVAPTYNYVVADETDVNDVTPTVTGCTVTDGSGLGEDDTIVFIAANSNTDFDQITVVESVSTNDITFMPISQIADDLVIKKIAGATTGSDSTDAGRIQEMAYSKTQVYAVKVVNTLTNGTMKVYYFYQASFRPGVQPSFGDGSTIASLTLNFKPLAKKKTLGGVTRNTYGQIIDLPTESA